MLKHKDLVSQERNRHLSDLHQQFSAAQTRPHRAAGGTCTCLLAARNNYVGWVRAPLLALMNANFPPLDQCRSTQDLRKPYWCLCMCTHTHNQATVYWLTARVRLPLAANELGCACGEGKWNKTPQIKKKKKGKWDYSKGGLYFYYTGARRQCASSALIHNKSAKLLLSLETKIAVALKTHWKHLLSSLFFFPLLFLVQKWYKQQYKIFVLLTVTKKGFWTGLTDANCFCASAWIQQNSRSLPWEQPQSCGLLHSFSIVKGNMQNHN